VGVGFGLGVAIRQKYGDVTETKTLHPKPPVANKQHCKPFKQRALQTKYIKEQFLKLLKQRLKNDICITMIIMRPFVSHVVRLILNLSQLYILCPQGQSPSLQAYVRQYCNEAMTLTSIFSSFCAPILQ
jgi:hypothetical protein